MIFPIKQGCSRLKPQLLNPYGLQADVFQFRSTRFQDIRVREFLAVCGFCVVQQERLILGYSDQLFHGSEPAQRGCIASKKET